MGSKSMNTLVLSLFLYRLPPGSKVPIPASNVRPCVPGRMSAPADSAGFAGFAGFGTGSAPFAGPIHNRKRAYNNKKPHSTCIDHKTTVPSSTLAKVANVTIIVPATLTPSHQLRQHGSFERRYEDVDRSGFRKDMGTERRLEGEDGRCDWREYWAWLGMCEASVSPLLQCLKPNFD
jgi:hypothetical protein